MARTRRQRRKRRQRRRRTICGGNGNTNYVGVSLEFELPGRFPHTLTEEDIEEIKMKIGQYFAGGKVPFTYFGMENNYHIFTTLRSKSAYFNLSGGSQSATAGVFVDYEIALDTMAPAQLTNQDISDLKSKIRYMVKDSAQHLIYKGLFSNMHVFVSDPSVIHGRQF